MLLWDGSSVFTLKSLRILSVFFLDWFSSVYIYLYVQNSIVSTITDSPPFPLSFAFLL